MLNENQAGTAQAAAQLLEQKGGGTIGSEQVRQAQATLDKYKQGKKSLEDRIVANDQWYRMRHWELLEDSKGGTVKPVSGWLFNALANKHAAAMDNYPRPTILAREQGDVEEAKRLSAVIPVVLANCDFEDTYDAVNDYKLKMGTGVYGVFWDPRATHGMGDVSIQKIDLLSLFWEPGVTDIQQSRNVFVVELMDKDLLGQMYPQMGDEAGASMQLGEYVHDDSIDTSDKAAVVDWYYKKWQDGRMVLHYCKYCGDKVLFATENSSEFAERGWYDHGLYPFVVDALFRVEGELAGFGYIDVAKSAQEYIDRGNAIFMESMAANARPRTFVRQDAGINEAEYQDKTKEIVHYEGDLNGVMPITGTPLPSVYVQLMRDKVDELKETTGNRDVSTGGSTSGVTAASAIAAMQEAGSKLDRQSNRGSYRAFRKVCTMVIELIRQFYETERHFRITGANGTEYAGYSNENLVPQMQTVAGQELGYSMPYFDLEIGAEKQSPYSRLSQNEMALQFYSAGFFDPRMADQALACLGMMDFDRKEAIMETIIQNRESYNQQQMMAMMGGMPTQNAPAATAPVEGTAEKQAALGGDGGVGESAVTKEARTRVEEASAP